MIRTLRSIAILVLLWCVLVAVGSMHSYGDVTTSNAGVWWYVPLTNYTQHCGIEYRGHVGLFCDVD